MALGAETAKLVAELSLKDKLTPGVNKALGSVQRLEKGVGRIGSGAGQLSAGLARAGTIIGGAVVTGLAGAAKASIDFEDAFQGVVKTVDEADLKSAGSSFEQLSRSIRDLATDIPVSANELAGIAESAGALGIKAKDIESFTKTVALLSVTTNVAADDAATALGQLGNVIGLTGDDFDNFGATLVDLGNKGASTEAEILEITRRSGAAANLIGLAKDATVGWAAAAANLGLNQELAGTALQNFYLKTQLAISGPGGLKKVAAVAGVTGKQFKRAFEKDASGALETFVKGLRKMPAEARLKTVMDIFGKGSGLTRLILGLADSVDTNLTPALDNATTAWEQNTALSAEAEKRFKTVKSSLQLLRNGLTEAAITIGEGFTPALARSAGKLSEFLKQDANKSALKNIGEDIGKAIDKIEWDQVLKGAREFVDILKIALDYAKRMFDAVNALPTEIKAAGLGFLALNKLSGGLIGGGIGNIVGGIGETLFKSLGAKIPGIGGAFVQPVFVTNMPVGGLGGAAGGVAGAAKGGLSALSKVFLVGEAIGLAIAVNEVRNQVAQESTDHATAIQTQTQRWLAQNPSRADLAAGLGGVEQGIRDIKSNPLNVLVQGEALAKLEAMRTSISGALIDSDTTSAEKIKSSVDLSKDAITRDAAANAAKQQTAAERIRSGVDTGAWRTANATTSGASQIVGAINAIPAPIVNVNVSATTIEKTTNVTQRAGRTGGSRDQNPSVGNWT